MKIASVWPLLVSGFSFVFVAGCKSDAIKPVSSFELQKYLGRWYEIARLPTWFEKNMTDVTATYSLLESGRVKVENTGFQEGKKKTAIGKAKLAKGNKGGYLKVSFFGPFYADYKIIELDTVGYQYAMVASSFKYLWILCREPRMKEELLGRLVQKAKGMGFDTNNLFYTPHH